MRKVETEVFSKDTIFRRDKTVCILCRQNDQLVCHRFVQYCRSLLTLVSKKNLHAVHGLFSGEGFMSYEGVKLEFSCSFLAILLHSVHDEKL